MIQRFSHLYKDLFTTDARYIHLWGGRGRGGSHTATDFFLFKQSQPEYFRGYFMREIHKDVRDSLWRDYKDRLEDSGADEKDYGLVEHTMSTVCFSTGNTISSRGFKKSSGKSTAKMKSLAGATHVLIEEAEEISEEDFMQLDDSLRTVKGKVQIILLFNPPSKDHWIIRRWYNLTEVPGVEGYYIATPKTNNNLLSVFSTYLDNRKNIDDTTAANFEAYGNPDSSTFNEEHYYSVVKGYVSEGKRGRIFKNWKPISLKEFRELPYPSYFGFDFGYSEDPNGCIEVKIHRNKLYLHEILYEKGLTNPQIAKKLKLKGVGKRPIVADSAEPKSIKELQLEGLNVLSAMKGPDSINAGIKLLKSFEIHYTEVSENLAKEYQNYSWELDGDKVPTDTPEDEFNHLIDPTRYCVQRITNKNTTSITHRR